MSKIEGSPGYRGGWCIHYRAPRIGNWGNGHDTCEAGVRFDSLAKGPNQPCFLDNGQSKPGADHCDYLRRPTAEEIAAHEAWQKDRFGLFAKVMIGIKPWRVAHKGKNAAEVVECPACGGRLHLSIAAYNGHVHGSCETKGCVRWME